MNKEIEAYKIGHEYSTVDILLTTSAVFISGNDEKIMLAKEDALELVDVIKNYFEEN
ncbi:hypothetical protein ACRW9N_02425 [Listeria aquatica]|uniref:hypothetical protein n=1 Tax=Listeria aquatica TaxID=1494960 RepID=UPI003EF30759